MHSGPLSSLKATLLAATAALTLGFSHGAAAINYYLQSSQSSTDHYNLATDWFDQPSGGNQLLAMDPTGDYFNQGGNVRSGSGGSTFEGASLNMQGGIFQLRATTNSNVGTFNSLGGTSITNAIHATLPSPLIVTNFNNLGDTTIGNNDARAVSLTIGTLTGSGALILGSGSSGATHNLSITNATAYTGDMNLILGTFNADSDFVSAGGFNVSSGTLVTLDQALTFTSFSIAGSDMGVGTFTYEYLNTNYGSIFTTGSLAGSITVVPEPESGAMALLAVGCVFLLRRRGAA